MRHSKLFIIYFLACCMLTVFLPLVVKAWEIPHPSTYIPRPEDVEKHKKLFDDPRPYLKTFGPKQVLPKELYDSLTYDVETMKNLWAELVGFRAPEVVGKIHPEIKPGKYTYKDVQNNPAFKELMPPELYNRIKPGAPPLAGNIPEFEIIPTRQYYPPLPFSEATKRNLGKTKQDSAGYIVAETWEGGFPFPRPSGPFKTQQLIYNMYCRPSLHNQNMYTLSRMAGIDKNFKIDMQGTGWALKMRGIGRVDGPANTIPWYDKRAKDKKEMTAEIWAFLSPRDSAGMLTYQVKSLDPKVPDESYMYIPSMRRIRKMTTTDTQDKAGGQDIIYDDMETLQQKLSPDLFPYKYEIIGEREYLVGALSIDGSEYLSSKKYEWKNVKLERRPCYVIQLTQLDPHYVYSKRIIYMDKETFIVPGYANYDQKGRLYRSVEFGSLGWVPEMGTTTPTGATGIACDHRDLHCTLSVQAGWPAFYTREDINIFGMVKKGMK